jgi:hypothetical protein
MSEIVQYEQKEFCENIIRMRKSDGYLNATEMCKANGKFYNHYIDSNSTKEFLKELSSDTGFQVSHLVEVKRGGKSNLQGTWVHPQVAIHLAQWLSPKFAVAVSKWVFRFMTGDLSLINEIKHNNKAMEEKLNESIKDLEKSRTELEKQKKINSQLNNFVSNVKQRTKEEIIYIATTKKYAAENYFKVGGCDSKKLLKKRLAQYNTGRPSNDLYYFAYISTTSNYSKLESRIKDILVDFIENKDKEMYILHYDCLQMLIELIKNDYNKEVEYVNEFIRNITNAFLNKEPNIPNPINLNDEFLIEYKKDGMVENTITIEVKDNHMEEINVKIQQFINLCANKTNKDYNFSKDKDNKQIMIQWVDVLEHLNGFRRLKSAEWKKLFIKFYNKTKPLCLKVKGIGLPPIN